MSGISNSPLALPNAAIPGYAVPCAGSDGTNLRFLTCDTSGHLSIVFSAPQHVIIDSATLGTVTVAGTLTNNNAAPSTNNVGVLAALCNTSAPTFADGKLTTLSVDTTGSLRTTATLGQSGSVNTSDAAWTNATAGNTTVLIVNNSFANSNLLITLNQAPSGTLTGGVVTFEVSDDNSNWVGIQGVNPNTLLQVGPTYTLVAATYSAFLFSVNAPYFRVRLSTVITGTGTLTVGHSLSVFPNVHTVSGSMAFGGSLPAGTNVIGHVIVDANTAVIGHVIVDTAPSTAVTNAGTFAVTQGTASNLNATVTQQTLTKGTQGSTGVSTQDLKDAGRVYVVLSASLITGVTSEALATFTKNVNGTNTTAQTAYTITNGKTFRIQALYVAIANSTTVANNCIYNVRVAGSVSASSPIVMSNAATAPVAVATSKGFFALSIPDGMEVKGDGSIQIGVSHLENVTTASISSFTLTGYEY